MSRGIKNFKECDNLEETFKRLIDEDGMEGGDSLTVVLTDDRELVFRLEEVFTFRNEVNAA